MRRHWAYLKYVMRHKLFVFQECLKLGVPLWIALLHDWDKFLPDKWFAYARTFYKPDGSKQYQENIDFAFAWMLHQHRNKHHWQYWCFIDDVPLYDTMAMIWDRGKAQGFIANYRLEFFDHWELYDIPDDRVHCSPMPELYMREMLADWRGAGRAITGVDNTLEWYIDNYYKIKLHNDTRLWFDYQLTGLALPLEVIAQSNNVDVIKIKDYLLSISKR